LYKPLISENQRDEDDILNYYNPNPGWTHSDYGAAELVQLNANIKMKDPIKAFSADE